MTVQTDEMSRLRRRAAVLMLTNRNDEMFAVVALRFEASLVPTVGPIPAR